MLQGPAAALSQLRKAMRRFEGGRGSWRRVGRVTRNRRSANAPVIRPAAAASHYTHHPFGRHQDQNIHTVRLLVQRSNAIEAPSPCTRITAEYRRPVSITGIRTHDDGHEWTLYFKVRSMRLCKLHGCYLHRPHVVLSHILCPNACHRRRSGSIMKSV